MVTWVLESNVFAEVCFDEMIAHFQANAIPHHVVRVIPFVHEIDGKVPEIEGPCVVYGSIGVQKLAHKHGWTPGVFGDAEVFSESKAARNLGELYLNWGQGHSTMKKLGDPEVLTAWSRLLVPLGQPPLEEFFIKPNTDTKEFAGTVMRLDEFQAWHKRMIDIGYLEDADFKVVLSRPKELGCEWRVVVVDGQIIESSLYRQFRTVKQERHIIPEVEAVVREAHRLYNPAPAYVIDVAQVRSRKDFDDYDYRVIEYNTLNSAGLYACRPGPIVDAINAMLEKA
jgi:hypothetical protein